MKKRSLFFLLVLVLISPITLMGVNLTDYTVTDAYFKEAYINGSFNFASGNQDQANYDGSGSANYKTEFSTLPFSWKLNVNASTDFSRGATDGDSLKAGYNLTANTSANKYLTDKKIFGYGSIDLGYRKIKELEDADNPYSKLGFGGGYGRVYDATVLARAMLYIDDLKKYGIISGDISDNAYLEIAKLIDKEEEYQSKYGMIEYKKYWFEAMEKVLLEENVLKDNKLSALGVVRMEDVLAQRVNVRRHGWEIRAGVGYIFSNYDKDIKSDPSLDVSAEYALPFRYNFQLIELLKYSTILSDEASQLINNSLLLSFQLTNKISWENSWDLGITLPSDKDKENEISNRFASTYYYYISNVITANASLVLDKFDDGIDDNDNDDINSSFRLGLQYRIR